MAARRQNLVAGLTGRVLEVGAGNGLNLKYYGGDTQVIALEPDAYMRRLMAGEIGDAQSRVDVVEAHAAPLPFADRAFDAVVVSLVLCTVPDPASALGEIRRVVAPGGMVRFMEHVRPSGIGGRAFDLFNPLWRRMAAGCQLNRRTEAAIERGGFRIVRIERSSISAIPHVFGEAVAATE